MEKYGFVYIWYDRKRKMYYIGSHWGTEDDGYICSSTRMRNAYKRRPTDFRRKTLNRVYDKYSLLEMEQYWLDKVKNTAKYYNLIYTVSPQWWMDEENRKSVVDKMKQKVISEEHRRKISVSMTGKPKSEAAKQKMVGNTNRRGKPTSKEGRAKISASHTGLKQTEEHKLNRSKAVKEWWRKRKMNNDKD